MRERPEIDRFRRIPERIENSVVIVQHSGVKAGEEGGGGVGGAGAFKWFNRTFKPSARLWHETANSPFYWPAPTL